MRTLIALVILLVGLAPAAFGQSATQTNPSKDVQKSDDQYLVGPGATLMIKGVFLLIRKGGQVGAVLFLSIELSSDVGLGRAKYESYFFQNDLTKSFSDRGVVRQAGEIDLKPLWGLGHLAFQLGKDRIDVGPWSFGCSHPGLLNNVVISLRIAG